ncbi:MAG: SBBP repeat-containing protein, partial [Bacteroidia bacterium]|nr:SBBP repeat-containing protein [Bacteroidia bacterium]
MRRAAPHFIEPHHTMMIFSQSLKISWIVALLTATELRAGDGCASRPAGFRLAADAFIPNVGQAFSATGEKVHYYAQIEGGTVFFLDNRVAFVFEENPQVDARLGDETPVYAYRTDLTFPGANPHPPIEPHELRDYVFHYHLASLKAENVPAYGSLVYRNLWPGVDLIFKIQDGNLKYDLLFAPGVSHRVARLKYSDYRSLKIENGQIVLSYPGGELREAAPVSCVLSENDGRKTCLQIESAYRLSASGEITFRVKGRKKNDGLIIDPLVRRRATFYGGTSNDNLACVAIDGENAVVAAGYTRSTNPYLIQNGVQSIQRGLADVLIVKFDANGVRRWSTFLGGQGEDAAYSMAVDASGNVYLTGSTRGVGFPELNPFQSSGLGNEDAFVASLQANGTLRFSSRFGGSSSDRGLGLAFDALNNRVIAVGNTSSSDLFGAINAYSGNRDGFVVALTHQGALVWSTYIGAERDDRINAVAVDAEGKIYVVGGSASAALPGVSGNYTPQNQGANDAFVCIIGDDGAVLRSTFLGGADNDEGLSVSLNNNYIAVVGRTRSSNMPVSADARQPNNNGGGDGFFSLLNYELTGLPYSTYLGGTGGDELNGVRLISNRAYFVGHTLSADFPVLPNDATPPNQDSNAGLQDAVLGEFALSGPSPAYINGFYYGGARNDAALGLAAVPSLIAVVGTTRSVNLPINFAQQPFQSFKGVEDGFLAVYETNACPAPGAIVLDSYQAICDTIRLRFTGGAAPYTVQILDPSEVLRTFVSDNQGRIRFAHFGGGFYDLVSILDNNLCVGDPNAGDGGFTFDADALLRVESDSIRNNVCNGDATGAIEVSVAGGTPPYNYAWSGPNNFVAFNEDISGLRAGTYTLTVTDAQGCRDTFSAEVSEPESLVVQVQSDFNQLTCLNPTGTLSATITGGTPGYSVVWQGPEGFTATGTQIEVANGGSYTVLVSDANGCTANASFLVVADFGTLSIDAITTPTSCGPATDGTLTVFLTGGTPPYIVTVTDTLEQTYNPSGNFAYSNLPAGEYRVTVTDAQGCRRSIIRQVLVGQGTLQISMSGSAVACYGDLTGSVNATVVGGTPPYHYRWTLQNGEEVAAGVGAPFSQLINRPAGEYHVTVTDDVGCQISGFFTVTQPEAPLAVNVTAQTNVACHGQTTGSLTVSVTGGASALNYYFVAWTGPNGFTSTNTSITNLAAGTYSLVATDINGCTASISVQVTQPTAPITINLGQIVPSICGGSGGAVLINPTGGVPPYTYQWSTGVTTQNLSNVPAGLYTVVVRDANGCTATENFVVNQLGTTLLASFNTPVDATCFETNNGSISVVAAGGVPPYQYIWRRNGVVIPLLGPNLINIPGGDYSVTVRDANGCTFEIPFIPVRQRSQINVGSVTITPTTCAGDGDAQIELSGISGGTYPGETVGYQFRWAFDDTVVVLSGNDTILSPLTTNLPIGPGTYTLTIVALSPDGCSRTWILEIPETQAFAAPAVVTDATGCGVDNYGAIRVLPSGGLPVFTVRTYSLPDAPQPYNVTLDVDLGQAAVFGQVPPGFYAYRASNAEGCFLIDTVFVQASSFAFNAQAQAGTCASLNNGKIIVSAGQPATYYLYRSNTTLVNTLVNVLSGEFTGLSEGKYFIVARRGDCFGTRIVDLDFPEFKWTARTTQPASCNFSADGVILALAVGYNDIRYTVQDTAGVVVFPPQIGGVFNSVRAGVYVVRAFRQSEPQCFIEYRDTVEYETELTTESVEPIGQTCSGSSSGGIAIEASSDPPQTIYYALFREDSLIRGPQTMNWFNLLPPGEYTVRIGLDPQLQICFEERQAQIQAFNELTLTLNPDVLNATRCLAPFNFGSFTANLTFNNPPNPIPGVNYDLYDEDGLALSLGTGLGTNYTFSEQTVNGLFNIPPGEYRVRATIADGLLAGCYAEAKLEIRPFVDEPVQITQTTVSPALACGYDNANGDASGQISVQADGASSAPGAQIWYRLESTDGFVVRRWQLNGDFLNLLPANYIVCAALFVGDPNNPEECAVSAQNGCSDTTILRIGIRSPVAVAPLNNNYPVIPTTPVGAYPQINTPNLGANRARIYWKSEAGFEGGFAGTGGNPTPTGASNTYQIRYRVVGSGPGGWSPPINIPDANMTNTATSGVVLWHDLTGLQPQTIYEYRIRISRCGSSTFTPVSSCGPQTGSTNVGGIFSEWAAAS